ncbi:TfoX/Sxy family DNA transformation protein [Aquabacterium sp. NJ1]|uniref:TfoX/Sxy family DNA transformation protein n=1 Tax=Aquabacterium sp. NJ1 TaxID=1538295 RepID=UPI000689A0AA|nr:TfoX/Sxy family DNA transformation protein [Aquabacterium sp. NJ1]
MTAPASASQKQAFANFVVELMAGFAPVQARRMFGGFGMFHQGLMLAIIIEDKLYFKVDDVSEPRFVQRGLPRFQYESKGGRTASLRYCEAPPEVYDEREHMAEWTRLAYECAVRQQKKPARASKSRLGAKARGGAPVAAAEGDEADEVNEVHATVADLRNLGPKSLEMLAKAGIHSADDLQRLGAVMAYARTKAVCPKASLNLLWALEGALTGRDWKVVAETDRASLLMALEDVQHHLVSKRAR